MLQEPSQTRPETEISLIRTAADLLREMMLELQRLEPSHPRLTLNMAAVRCGLRQRVDTLHETVQLLTSSQNAPLAHGLTLRAKALIVLLAGELDQLISHADIA